MTLKISRALISVSDKTGVAEFAAALAARGVELLSTGGTARHLADADVPVTEVSDYTGFPEIMDGRVKTLHPKIHGGILGRGEADAQIMREHDIPPIDLVVINLYPFRQTVARPDVPWEVAIENIDIGGPAMLRAAAKNHAHTAVVVDPARYRSILEALEAGDGGLDHELRRSLAAEAFAHTAAYDAAVSAYFEKCIATDMTMADPAVASAAMPQTLTLHLTRALPLRYGENPHQQAALYQGPALEPGTIAAATRHQGKPLSFNNLADADAALATVRRFDSPACVIVKHANPCGVAVDDDQCRAYERARRCDPTSAFGGIIAFNCPLTGETASRIVANQFVEVIVATEVSAQAQAVLATKPDVRVLATGPMSEHPQGLEIRSACGGFLVQHIDDAALERGVREDRVVSARLPDPDEWRDLEFAWQVAAMVKSNAIVYARDLATIGIGAGQMSRVVSARIAGMKAVDEGLVVAGAVMASDAFFPFRDGIDAAAEAGIRAVIQPGGSRRDDEVIAAADEHDIAMVFTGVRHFRH